ncbi:DUF2777 family protein [Alteribacillus sp. HJP-4]|uniref:DUF2777 family protein n=1 Tax=Alteribacillus sp. HJP-4 TaxID=2775394 RepID=UPI0035CD2C4A
MNRTEAMKLKGKTVLIDKGEKGVYYGELLDIAAPPKKMWAGKVKIKGVIELPILQEVDSLPGKKTPAYMTVPGSKIQAYTAGASSLTYAETVVQAINKKLQKLYDKGAAIQATAKSWATLGSRFGEMDNPFDLQKNVVSVKEDYVYYQLKKEKGRPFLHEPVNGDVLDLEECPFEFEISKPGKSWIEVTHLTGFTFEDLNGKEVQLKEFEWVRIHKQQFQPFHILLNELEDPSQKSLLHGIHSLGFTLDQLDQCHNHLLQQLLHSDGIASFQGVNFISFQNNYKTLMVQHHYERELKQDNQDFVFDRFEFTTDEGERSISSYTNIYSKGHES